VVVDLIDKIALVLSREILDLTETYAKIQVNLCELANWQPDTLGEFISDMAKNFRNYPKISITYQGPRWMAEMFRKVGLPFIPYDIPYESDKRTFELTIDLPQLNRRRK
jgi:hypothetical protein